MIAKQNKFPMRTEFLHFRSRAKRCVTQHTSCSFLHTPCDSRLAVVVPHKVNKRATTRNWLKRLTYDTLWPAISEEQVDCVVVFKPLLLLRSPQTKELIISELSKLPILRTS